MTTAILTRPPKPKSRVKYNEDGAPILPVGAEFVDGHIVEKAVSEKSNWVSAQLALELTLYQRMAKTGIIFTGAGEQGFQCFPHKPKQVRKPDAAFVRRELTGDFLADKGFTTDVPELVAEIVSPQDKAELLEEKLAEYKEAGIRLIWIIYPNRRMAKILRIDGRQSQIDETGILDGEDVLPGFKLPLAAVLPPK